MSRSLALALAVTALAVPARGEAQDWRTLTTMRQFAGEEQLRVDVEYGAGELRVTPATGNTLYRANLRYDADAFRPVNEYRDGRLRLGFHGGKIRNIKHNQGARLDLSLGTGVPMDLSLKFGAVEADLELGGLRLRSVSVATGASATKVRFSSPNPERCRLVSLEAGAAEFRAYGLGNANAEHIKFDGGVGDITLDFSGQWQNDMTADIDMGIGSLTLRVPRGLGLRINKDTFLTSFSPDDMIKRGGTYYSENWENADRKLTINIDAAFGSINLRWVDGASTTF